MLPFQNPRRPASALNERATSTLAACEDGTALPPSKAIARSWTLLNEIKPENSRPKRGVDSWRTPEDKARTELQKSAIAWKPDDRWSFAIVDFLLDCRLKICGRIDVRTGCRKLVRTCVPRSRARTGRTGPDCEHVLRGIVCEVADALRTRSSGISIGNGAAPGRQIIASSNRSI